MNFPDNLRYTKDHEWLRLEGDTAVVGITDFAQDKLGDVVYVEVDTIGKSLHAGDMFGTADSVKAASDLYVPIAGTVTEKNPALDGSPGLVNSDPYGEGWMIKMKLANPADVDKLMTADAYNELVSKS